MAARKVYTDEFKHDLLIADNLLDQEFGADMPDTRWTADISYIWTSEGWLYLGVVLDLFSRRIVSWAMGVSLERSLVLGALSMALTNRQPAASTPAASTNRHSKTQGSCAV